MSENCGTGSGGFQPGNKCAGGGSGGDSKAADTNAEDRATLQAAEEGIAKLKGYEGHLAQKALKELKEARSDEERSQIWKSKTELVNFGKEAQDHLRTWVGVQIGLAAQATGKARNPGKLPMSDQDKMNNIGKSKKNPWRSK